MLPSFTLFYLSNSTTPKLTDIDETKSSNKSICSLPRKEASINYTAENDNQLNFSHNQTFPKSNNKPRKQKRLSVQICQDPLHLYNYTTYNQNASNCSLPRKGLKGRNLHYVRL